MRISLHWYGVAITEQQDGSATATVRTNKGTLTVQLKRYVWADLCFEIQRTKEGMSQKSALHKRRRRAVLEGAA